MDERIGFALFFTIFVSIYALLNYFVLSRYTKLLGIEKNYWFYILLGMLAVSYVVASALEALSDNGLFRIIYMFASVWMGILFLLFCVLILHSLVNLITPLPNWISAIVMLSVVLLITIYAIVNAYSFSTKELNIYTDKNIGTHNTLRIVQITDLHLGPVNGEKYLERIIKKVNKVKPDVVLITGDLLDGRYPYNKDMFKKLDNINATVYFITGNHDYYAGLSKVEGVLNGTKVKWLRNELVGFDGINIIGLDDSGNKNNVNAMLYALNMEHDLKKKYTVLMNHRPLGWKNASKYVDLMISGHTHAGQIWPFTYLAFIEGQAVKGIYRVPGNERFMLYVNSGTGTWGPPMRIGSHTEITVFNIKHISS